MTFPSHPPLPHTPVDETRVELLIQTGPRRFFILRILQREGERPCGIAACVGPFESRDLWAALHRQAERCRSRNRETWVQASQISYFSSLDAFTGFWIRFSNLPVDSVHPSGILKMHLGFSKISLKWLFIPWLKYYQTALIHSWSCVLSMFAKYCPYIRENCSLVNFGHFVNSLKMEPSTNGTKRHALIFTGRSYSGQGPLHASQHPSKGQNTIPSFSNYNKPRNRAFLSVSNWSLISFKWSRATAYLLQNRYMLTTPFFF